MAVLVWLHLRGNGQCVARRPQQDTFLVWLHLRGNGQCVARRPQQDTCECNLIYGSPCVAISPWHQWGRAVCRTMSSARYRRV
ncbi:hypothetical protein PR048_027063 [Dryococelus australis]|uniref:Secreted protein n=1 Tax=Dryococelus australis TaxID=614101 RepID=A0ABQ9GGH0_9NEOP|nr:hypothetical protein PR048_027063 [Dryococelus australis]